MSTAELKAKMLELLRTDEEFRLAVAGLIGLGEILRRLEEHDRKFNEILERLDRHEAELAKLREDLNRLREDMNKGFERYDLELSKLREDMNRGFERYDRELIRLREDMNKGFELIRRHVDALGARWGLLAEGAFREGLKGILEEELGLRVERWIGFDDKGLVYGHPSPIEVDVAVRDGRVILVEVSSHIRPSDVIAFKRKADVYAEGTGRKPDKLIMISPYVDGKARELADKLGITIYARF